MPRIAIVDENKCKPDKCSKECIHGCPPQKSGKHVIEIEDIGKLQINNLPKDKKQIAKIVEDLCIGCNICVKRCPFNAIKIINLPDEIPSDIIHRYNKNGFRLYKLPTIKQNIIIGIIGENGVGKTTLIDILSNTIRPNFENFTNILSDKEIVSKFRGTSLQDYFNNLYKKKLTFSIKQQKIKKYIQNITVSEFIKNIPINDSFYSLEINKILEKHLHILSGGELQRLICWKTASIKADVYIFDEPSNFLDIKQRLEISKLITSLKDNNKYVLVIEHDLSMLDYIADELYIIYGKPSAYGIVSVPLTPLEGINMYLNGYIPTENIRFREEEFNLKPVNDIPNTENIITTNSINFSSTKIKYHQFELKIPSGIINLESINVILGENGTGKTTFINWLTQNLEIGISIKEQTPDISQFKNLTVETYLQNIIGIKLVEPSFQTDVVKPLNINKILNRKMIELSGGELQKVLIVSCLGKKASIYLLDEPSANLDIENRLNVIKAIKKFIINNKKCCFIIEHDIMMSVSFAQEQNSKIILVSKESETDNNKVCIVSEPMNFNSGINTFLQQLNITMRLSTHNRPRINKYNSRLDNEQKKSGIYYGTKN